MSLFFFFSFRRNNNTDARIVVFSSPVVVFLISDVTSTSTEHHDCCIWVDHSFFVIFHSVHRPHRSSHRHLPLSECHRHLVCTISDIVNPTPSPPPSPLFRRLSAFSAKRRIKSAISYYTSSRVRYCTVPPRRCAILYRNSHWPQTTRIVNVVPTTDNVNMGRHADPQSVTTTVKKGISVSRRSCDKPGTDLFI
mmetsp:Transcript_9435/g.10536  ORF Transcript_9435/g.10536 Transcript_9435/m.10536 type:complete len:194 (+) Transcript_9435:264-845(+)